jgi:hypothetical protein
MKKIALTAVIVASLSTGAAVAAEPFKDRYIDYRATAQPEISLSSKVATVQVSRFNNGGIDYRDAVSVSATTPRAEVDPVISGFNDRSHAALANQRQGVSGEADERLGFNR